MFTTWSGHEDTYKYSCLASLATGVIGVVGVLGGILLPREGILDILYTIWMFVVAANFVSVGVATFAHSSIIASRLALHNLVVKAPSGSIKPETISSIRDIIYNDEREYAAFLAVLTN